jgi:PAS domain S-box-containing protein
VFDAAFGFIGLLDADGMVLEANQSALDLIGEQREHVVGRALWETPWFNDDPAHRERLRDVVGRAVGGEVVRFETYHVAANGRRVEVDFSLSPVRDQAGRVTHLVAEGRDVTDRTEVVERLVASEAKFSGILGLALDAIVTTDEAETVLHFNRGAETIFGYAADEVIGKPLSMLLPERFRAVHEEHVHAFGRSPIASRPMAERRAIYGRRKGGAEFPAEASISHVRVAGRSFFTAVLRDITERRAEEARERFLATVGASLATSLDVARTARTVAELCVPEIASACIVDLVMGGGHDRRVAAATDAAGAVEALEHLGVPNDDSASRVIDVLRTREAELIRAVTDDWLEAHSDTEAHLRAFRRVEPASIIIAPLVAREQVLGTVTWVRSARAGSPYDERDLTLARDFASRAALALDNARLYDASLRSLQSHQEVLDIVSHDLRNPVSAVAMAARVLLDDPPESAEERVELLDAIYESSQIMFRMIRDLRDIASLESGHLVLEQRPTPAAPLADQVVGLFAHEARQREVILEAVVPAGLPAILGDAERIVQALSSVVANAVRHTPAGGRVSVAAHAGDACVVFEVTDTGIGIAPEELPHLFERHWVAQRSTKGRGSGLGLAVAKGLVEAHGGRIWALSVPNEGSTFSLSFPIAAES